MARPVGIERELLGLAARQLAAERGGATWLEIARVASAVSLPVAAGAALAGERVQRGIAPGVARSTIKNMVKAGELRPVGSSKPAGSVRWMVMYAPAERHAAVAAAATGLEAAMRGWVRGGAM